MPLSRGEVDRITGKVIALAGVRGIVQEQGLLQLICGELPADDPITDRLRRVILKRVQTAISHPDSEEFVVHVPELCNCPPGERACADACAVDAIVKGSDGRTEIDRDRCIDCGLCVDACQAGALVERTHSVRLAEQLRLRHERPIYAIVAPAFVAQFGADVTPRQFKAGLRRLGFTDVLEVALAADIITALESEEYLRRQRAGEKFVITSCCCPAFIKLVEKHRPNVAHLVSDSVSPMVALGRMLKRREPDCQVVFIGPCLAKRSEAKRPELADAIDSVLTFKELQNMLQASGIDLRDDLGQETAPFAEASHDGRIYAHTGGVTAAIERALRQHDSELEFRPLKGNGLKQCSQILAAIEDDQADGNFMEGMACPGGCVGGPGTCVPVELAAQAVDRFAGEAGSVGALENRVADQWRQAANDRGLFASEKR